MLRKVRTGLESLLESPPGRMAGKRIGLLCNPASVDPLFNHARDLLCERFPGKLTALFSPQHGFYSEKQDNMIESDHRADPVLNIPVFSLYGKTRIPEKEMLDRIDILVIDLQDAGTRVYTFIHTMSLCMEAARKQGKEIVVLDRPNPVGGVLVEGNLLVPEYASFVGRFPMPMRHGLTIGELALLFNDHFEIGCDLDVVPMDGWKRKMCFRDTGLPWVAPSPNLPTPDSVAVYPGQVIWEGTNVSEGRGTTQPFEVFGAPFINPDKLMKTLGGKIPGAVLRKCAFEPTFNKWKGLLCKGFQIHVTDPNEFRPYATALKLLRAVFLNHKDPFEWKPPPYEYEFGKMPFDLICGDRQIRSAIENLDDTDRLEMTWRDELAEFKRLCRKYHLYS